MAVFSTPYFQVFSGYLGLLFFKMRNLSGWYWGGIGLEHYHELPGKYKFFVMETDKVNGRILCLV
jgi:hypothetical protein